MAVSGKFFTSFFQSAFNKEVSLNGSSSIKVMLCTSSYAPNQDTHQYKSSVTNEVSGAGYTATGKALTNVSVSVSAKKVTFDADDVSWTSATLTGANAPRYAVIYDSSPASDATRPLIGYIDFGDSSYAPNGGTLSISWHANGIGSVTVS